MRQDLTEIITALIMSESYEEEGKLEAINSLKESWPGLTGQEKSEIAAVAKAFEIMAVNKEDVFNEETLDEDNTDYFNSYPELVQKPKKRGLFRRKDPYILN